VKVEQLIRALGNPREGELGRRNFIEQFGGEVWASIDRLEALAELKHLADAGRIALPAGRRGTNTHVHTNESFSIFRSPSDAAWQGFVEGLDVLGINDHYTIDGHREFAQACRILGLRATFSMEAVALDQQYIRDGIRCNDPGNAGRTYLSAKGVVRELPADSQGRRDLEMMRRALSERNEEIVAKLNALLASLQRRGGLPAEGESAAGHAGIARPSCKLRLSFDDVLALTPSGNNTERHVCQALAELIDRSLPDASRRRKFLTALAGDVSDDDLSADAAYQNMLRAKLVKQGKPAYAEESEQAFISWERMISMFLEMGAIPTYPVLGNPVVELEEDIEKLFDELERRNLHAIEVIPHRNTRERLAAIAAEAAKRAYPVFNGTEHNTKTPMPLLDELSGSAEFIGQFTLGADVLIGHQLLSRYAGLGYVDGAGKLTISDREFGLDLFAFAGRVMQKPETLSMLDRLGTGAALKLVAGLHEITPRQIAWGMLSRAEIHPTQLAGVRVAHGKAQFDSPQAAEFLKNWADANLT